MLALASCAFAVVCLLPGAAAGGASASVRVESANVAGTPAIGALFTLSPSGSLGSHFCTGSVVDSLGGELVLTAAHCLSGRSPGTIAFVPDYHGGVAPFGIWTVTSVFVDGAWANSGDTDDDFAFVTVERSGSARTLEQLTGAELLGRYTSSPRKYDVIGYPDGGVAPIGCLNSVTLFSDTQLQFDCNGYTNGTSGSPLLTDLDPVSGVGTIVGVIGGYEQGGDTPAVSYAARFGANLAALYVRATGSPPAAPLKATVRA